MEGLWGKKDPGVTGFVSFANTTAESREVTLQALSSADQALALVPNEENA